MRHRGVRERLAHRHGVRFPVLLWVPGAGRAANLLDALHDIPFPMPIAIGVHSHHPAAPVWTLTTDPFHQRALHQLPTDPGPAGYPPAPIGQVPDGFDADDPLNDEDDD